MTFDPRKPYPSGSPHGRSSFDGSPDDGFRRGGNPRFDRGGDPRGGRGGMFDSIQPAQGEPEQPKKKDGFDTSLEYAGKAAKHTGKGIAAFVSSLKDVNRVTSMDTGRAGIAMSGGYILAGMLLWVVAYFAHLNTIGLAVQIAGGFIALGVSVLLRFGPVEKAIKNGEVEELLGGTTDEEDEAGEDGDEVWESGGEPSNPTIAPALPVVIEEDEPETPFGGVEDTAPTLPLRDTNLPALQEETPAPPKLPDPEPAIELPTLKPVEPEVVSNGPATTPPTSGEFNRYRTPSREWLWEQAVRNLPHANREYMKWAKVPKESPIVSEISTMLVNCAVYVLGVKQDDYEGKPVLDIESVEQNSYITRFTYEVKANTPLSGTSAKEKLLEAFCGQWANKVMKEKGLNAPPTSISGRQVDNLGKVTVEIIDRENSKPITIADVWEANKEMLLSSQLVMPLVLGVTDEGDANFLDLHKITSMIVAGEPNSGKTTTLLSLLLQIAILNSPREVKVDICDPKGGISDFQSFGVPHINNFFSDVDETIEYLKSLREEGEERRKFLHTNEKGSKSSKTWANYYMRHPSSRDKLPLKIVIIDEYIEYKKGPRGKEFEDIVLPLVTKLRAYGIFLWLVPHRVSNDNISKSIYGIISLRGAIRPSPEGQKSLADNSSIKPISTYNPGDCVFYASTGPVRDARGKAKSGLFFNKTIVPTQTFEIDDVSRFISEMWHGIDPEGFHSGDYIDDPDLGGWECDCEFRKHAGKKEEDEPAESSSRGKVSLAKQEEPSKSPADEPSSGSSGDIDDVFALMESLALSSQEISTEPQKEEATHESAPPSVEQSPAEPATTPVPEEEEGPQQAPPKSEAPTARDRLRMLEEGF